MKLAQRIAERLGIACPRYGEDRGQTGGVLNPTPRQVTGAPGVPGEKDGEHAEEGADAAVRPRAINRALFPGVAAMVDELRAAGFSPKVRWACEQGREIGHREPFDGIDVGQVLALDDRESHPVKVVQLLPKHRARRGPKEDKL